MTKTVADPEADQIKGRLRATWNSGDYDTFSRYMEAGAREFHDRLKIRPGSTVLDVACGSGQLALIAARAGARVTGCDIASRWIEKARARAAAEGLDTRFDEADVEQLPYGDGQFDAVVSLIGAMFAPRPELTAAELARVCKPGGLIAMANWTPEGFVGQMFRSIAKHIAPSGMPSPVLWGTEAAVRERFGDSVSSPRMERRMYRFEYPFPPADVVEFFRVNYGPMTRAFASIGDSAAGELRRELTGLWSTHNEARGGGTIVDAEYLEVLAVRAN